MGPESDILNILRALVSKPLGFKITIWEKNLALRGEGTLLDLALERIRADLSTPDLSYSLVHRGDTVGVYDYERGHQRLSYYHFRELIDDRGNGVEAKVYTGDGVTRYLRLNEYGHKFTRAEAVELDRLSGYRKGWVQELKSAFDPSEYLLMRIGPTLRNLYRVQKSPEGKLSFSLLRKTQIILLMDESREEIEEWFQDLQVDGIHLLDAFQVAAKQDAGLDGYLRVNSLPHQHAHRIPDILIFSRLSTTLDFLGTFETRGGRALVLTDRFRQVYNPTTWQDLAIRENYALIHFGKSSDFRYLNYQNSIFGRQSYITAALLNNRWPSQAGLLERVVRAESDAMENLLRTLMDSERTSKSAHPERAEIYQKLIRTVCQLLTPTQYYSQLVNSLESSLGLWKPETLDVMLADKTKMSEVDAIASAGETHLLIPDLEPQDAVDLSLFRNKDNIIPVSKDAIFLHDWGVRPLVIYHLDRWFLYTELFPRVLLGLVDLGHLRFVLYPTEARILIGIFRTFRNRIVPLIENASHLMDSQQIPEEEPPYEKAAGDPEAIDDLLEFDYGTFSQKYYITEKQRDPTQFVEVSTLGMTDGYTEYLAFVTTRFKPNLLEEGELRKVHLDSLAEGDRIVFFEGEGERGILEAYRDSFFYRDLRHIERVDLWKAYLGKYLEYDRSTGRLSKSKLSRFVKGINSRGLTRSEMDVRRWLDPDSIGTLHPREDLTVIAEVVGDMEFVRDAAQLAESCIHLQTKCKVVGKILKKFALKDLSGTKVENELREVDPELIEKLDTITKKIRTLTVRYIDRSPKRVDRTNSNRLIRS